MNIHRVVLMHFNKMHICICRDALEKSGGILAYVLP